tara:strand:+ start:43 stop:723 length:681 start_codon:yes stop_codon:yes gene_type:complete
MGPLAIAAVGSSVLSGVLGFSASRKQAKAQLRAGRERKKKLDWNAREVERATEINDKAFAFNIDSTKYSADFNEKQIRKEAAEQRWRTAHNESLSRRAKRRMVGSQRVSMSASGVASGGSMTDVMRDSEIETEFEIQTEVYNGLRMADKLTAQADILKYQAEVDAFNLSFKRSEAKRMGALEAKDLRWQGKIAEMGGQAAASASKMQGYASLLNSATSAYGTYKLG